MMKQTSPKGQSLSKKQIKIQTHLMHKTKLQFSNLIDSKLNNFINTSKANQKYRNTCLVQNLELLQSVPYSCFKKYELQTTPRKTPRKEEKTQAHQIQKVPQTQLKEAHSNRVDQWKAKFIIKKCETLTPNSSERINRTKSLFTKKNLEQQYLGLRACPYEGVAVQKLNHSNNHSAILCKNKESNNMVGNNAYLRKLRTKIEFYSLSTIINEQKDSSHLSPNVSSIEPKFFTRHPEQENSGKISFKNTRTWVKNSKSTRFQQKKKFKSIEFEGYRPWSGLKGDLINDLTVYI